IRAEWKAVRQVGEEILEVVQLVGAGGEGRGAHQLEAFADARLQRDRGTVAYLRPMRGLPDRRRKHLVVEALARALQVARGAGEVALAHPREVDAPAVLEGGLRRGRHAHGDLLA